MVLFGDARKPRSMSVGWAVGIVSLMLLICCPVRSQDTALQGERLPDFAKFYPGAMSLSVETKRHVDKIDGRDIHYTTSSVRYSVAAPISDVVSFYRQFAASIQAVQSRDSGESSQFRIVTFARKTPHFTMLVSANHRGDKTTVGVFYEVVQ